MTDNSLALSIRAKKLGLLIRDARNHSQKSLEECAEALAAPPERLSRFEMGQESPSLPELELLAYYLQVPLEHFWGVTTFQHRTGNHIDPPQLLKLRQKMIGVQIRQARMEAGMSVEDLAQKSGLSPELVRSYELGDSAIPLPALESLTTALNRPVKDFQDLHGPVGAWLARERAVQGIVEMPPDLQSFIGKPINRPYLELARRLSEMSVEKLRSVAEGLLEITL